MSADHYAGAGQRWATGAISVYGPLATELVAMSPHPLAGRTVLDVGAGTGAAIPALTRCGARQIAADLSSDMLAWNAACRPPAVVADIRSLPLPARCVDDTLAGFVLNHLSAPRDGFAELVRVTRPGGALLAAVFSNANESDAKDRVDDLARQSGWQVPPWYTELKASAAPLLGTAGSMSDAAEAAGLTHVVVEERAVDIGVTEADQLVDYRFGQAHIARWLDSLPAADAADLRRRAIETIRPNMTPYRPRVVFLSALVPPHRDGGRGTPGPPLAYK